MKRSVPTQTTRTVTKRMSFYFETREAFFPLYPGETKERDCQSGIKNLKKKNLAIIMDKESTGCVNNGS